MGFFNSKIHLVFTKDIFLMTQKQRQKEEKEKAVLLLSNK